MNTFYRESSKNLQIGDRLIRDKGIFSKHHGIYVGIHKGVPMVAENQYGHGVRYISLSEFLLNTMVNYKIEKFKGSEAARQNIIPRINKLLGKQYDLIHFNCEHFAELIQNGNPVSRQVNKALVGFGLLFFGLILSSE